MIAQRPLVDFETYYFTDCFDNEIRTKKKMTKLIMTLKTLQVTQKKLLYPSY